MGSHPEDLKKKNNIRKKERKKMPLLELYPLTFQIISNSQGAKKANEK